MRRLTKSRRTGSIVPDIFLYTGLFIGMLLIVFPFYNIIIISFARYEDVASVPFYIIPTGFSLHNYEHIFHDNKILSAMGISFFNVVVGSIMNLTMTVFAAYALSRKNLPFRKGMFYFIIITMFFSGGLIPWYMVIRDLGLINNIFAMTVPGMIGTFNVILMRNFFESVPPALEESARIDGAGEFTIMTRIYLPLSKPIIATVTLFNIVFFWNDWWFGQLFIHDDSLVPLSLLLRRAIIESSTQLSDLAEKFRASYRPVQSRSIQAAAIMVSIVPIMIVYPFLQRYFTKGIMLGAVKE